MGAFRRVGGGEALCARGLLCPSWASWGALWGTGVGRARLVAAPWGPTMLNSFGIIRAHGAFTFCDAEDDTACAAP